MAVRSRAGVVRVGIGGWTFAPWRGGFYPKGLPHSRELAYASRQLTSIEVNGTFYSTQTPATFARWHDETPDDFVFALKAPRFATNRKLLATAGESIERFLGSGLLRLGDKLGPINWQFAPTKRFDAADFGAFLKLLPASLEGRALRHAVEVRHESFRDPTFIALARRHRVAVVVAGDSDFPQLADLTAPFVYARLMGSSERVKTGYGPTAVARWCARAERWANGAAPDDLEQVGGGKAPGRAVRDVYLYVISGAKQRNPVAAQALLRRLGKAGQA